MDQVDTYEVGTKALRPLMRAYWSTGGWRKPAQLPVGAALARAVATGVMFDGVISRDHDEWVGAARAAVRAVTLQEVTDAFVSSLSSRRLDLRSALGSYAVARHLPDHAFEPGVERHLCHVCGLFEGPDPTDPNLLSFERFKWGGVRRDDVAYVAFDLEQLQRAPREAPSEEATSIGRALLDELRAVPPRETATAALARLRMLTGTDEERAALLDTLGVCGVLRTRTHPGYLTSFVAYHDRDYPPSHFMERTYPVCWWRGADGVDEEAVRYFLGPLA